MLDVPVAVAQQWLGWVEPRCGLEERNVVVFPNPPFAVVDRGVVECADGDGVVDVGGATVEPFDDVVDLTVHCGRGAAGGLAATVPG